MTIARLFDRLTLKAKIIGLAAFLLLAMAGSGFYALTSMSQINKELVAVAEEDIPLTKALTHITTNQLEQAVNFERAIRYAEEMASDASRRSLFNTSVDAFNKYSKAVEEGLIKGEKIAQDVVTSSQGTAQAEAFQAVFSGLKAIETEHVSYEQHARKAIEMAGQLQAREAWGLIEKVEAEEKRIDHALGELLGEVERFTARAAVRAEEHEAHATNVLYVILAVAMLVGLCTACWVIRDALRRINYAISVAEIIASGDLRDEVAGAGKDEIGRLLQALGVMRDGLYNMISEIHESSNGLSVAAEELATASNQMSESVNGQREDLQLAATAFTEMAATVQEVARNAGTAAEATHAASDASQTGKNVICGAVTTIRGLAEAVETAAGVVEQLGQASEGIGTVVDVIKSIAEQTNLLALNAAIEAARAGEQGRGFAVVADEVRTLAQRTQASTQEIEDMIERLQNSSRSAVTSMEHGREQARQSVSQAMNAGQSFEKITTSIGAISDMNTQIAGAAEEQAVVTEDINRNLSSISEGAEQNASAMVQTSAASDELAQMAASLQNMVRRFQIA